MAFWAVFQRRQTRFRGLLGWLDVQMSGRVLGAQAAGLRSMVERYYR